MCIIIHKPKDRKLPEDLYKRCWDRNDDGAGFMYSVNDSLVIVKGLMTWEDFITALDQHTQDHEMIIHFRIRTHGEAIPELTHPFRLSDKKTGMAHNGIIYDLVEYTSPKMSDSKMFAELLSKTFGDQLQKMLSNSVMKWMIAKTSPNSKYAFMTHTGKVIIMNQHLGVEDLGCWFSNTSYAKPAVNLLTSPKDHS